MVPLNRAFAGEYWLTVQGFGQFYKPAEERLNQLLTELPKLEAECPCEYFFRWLKQYLQRAASRFAYRHLFRGTQNHG